MILSISKIYVKVKNLNIIYNCLYFLLRNTIGLIQCPMFVTQFHGMFPILILATGTLVILSSCSNRTCELKICSDSVLHDSCLNMIR